MDKYWEDPRLDDEGTYDYLVEELPSDTAKWQWYYQKCDSCGKYHKLNFESTHCFYCWDGWDSMSYVECWRCKLKNKIYAIKARIKRKIRTLYGRNQEYNRLIQVLQDNGVKITKELKQKMRKIANMEAER